MSGAGSLGFNARTDITGVPTPPVAALGDYVWEDLNANGQQDSGEPGIPGVLVTLLDSSGNPTGATTTTDSNGKYLFGNLTPGTYGVSFPAIPGYTRTTTDAGADETDSDADATTGKTGNYTLAGGETNRTVDAGYFKPAAIGDYIWHDTNANGLQDSGETGVLGATVELFTAGNALVGTQVTAADGLYLFTNLTPGDYYVKVTPPAGYFASPQNIGGDDAIDSDADTVTGVMATTNLISGETDLTWDAGLFQKASLGDFVWHDKNANGIQDGGELGIEGVTVKLLNAGGTVIGTTMTNASGAYGFTNLVPGTYSVQFEQPSGYPGISAPNQGANDAVDSDGVTPTLTSATTTLASGQHDPTLDQGFYKLAALGDYVWDDKNADGDQDANELPIPGVTVNLLNAGGTVIGTAITDANGLYLFENLTPGTYSVEFVQPAGYVPTGKDLGGNDATDSDADTVTGKTGTYTLLGGETNRTVDAGFYKLVNVGDFVWHDLNINGRQDVGEPGIAGVVLTLTGTDGSGAPVSDTRTTDVNGAYNFNGLKPGNYSVSVTTPPADFLETATASGLPIPVDIDVDSNTSPALTSPAFLPGGANDYTLDFGFYKLSRLGDFVWSDLNADGQQDGGEPGIAGVNVVLTGTNFKGQSVNLTTTTSGTGYYLFDNLFPGSYVVTFPTLVGFVRTVANAGPDATDSDASVATGMTATYVLGSNETNLTVDAGYFPANPKIQIVKLTNGTDNDTAPGLLVPVGSPITWTYRVTSVGSNEPIKNVLVRDDNGTPGNTADDFSPTYVGGDDGDGLLEVGETWIFTKAGGPAILGQYTNDSVVTGNGNISNLPVTDDNPDNYFGTNPTINIVKKTNGTDNDVAPGLEVVAGSAIAWTYFVTSAGSNEPIKNVVVVDDNGTPGNPGDDFSPTFTGGDANNNGLLDPTETWTYSKGGAIAIVGQYTNNAVVTGLGNTSNIPVTDDNPDNYFGKNPGIDIEKTTDGTPNGNPVDSDYDNEDAPNGPGVPVLTPGTTVTWTYKVTNTGNVAFAASEIALVDDNGTASTSDDLSIANGAVTFLSVQVGDADALLEPGEVWLYSASGTVQNLATPGAASTVDFSGSTASSGTAGNIRPYTVGGVSVNVSGFSRDKSTGQWATAFLGAYSGGLGVTDSGEGDGSSNRHTVDNDGRDNYVLFEFSENVVVDSAFLGYIVGDSDVTVWIGTIAGTYASHTVLDDTVLASLGFTEVNLSTASTTRLADLNAGSVAGNVLVIAAKTGESDDKFKIEKLTVKKVLSGTYENKATVTAPGTPSDSDLSHYKNPTAKIDIEKFVKEVTVVGGEGLTPGYWKQTQHFPTWVPTGYTQGQSFNSVFGVSDPDGPTLLGALQTGGGGFDALGRHAVAALLNASHPTIEYKFTAAQVIAKVQSAYANPGSVESIKNELAAENERGADLATNTGTATDPTPGNPGSDADVPQGLVLQTGESVLFTFIVTNPGAVALTNVVVTDDNQTPNNSADDFNPAPVLAGMYNVGDTDQDNQLDVGEAWKYTYGPIAVTEGQHTNNATVTGTPVGGGSSVTDNDPANWFGITDIDGSIRGKKFRDVSGNGLNEVAGPNSPADVPMGGVTVYIDADNDGVKDAGEHSTVTAADGSYLFTGLTPGTYTVREVVPAGWIRTAPVATNAYVVVLDAGENETGKNFANYEMICGACTVDGITYKLVHTDGTVEVVTDLRGETREGDIVTAYFSIDEAGSFPVTLVSYTAPEPYFDANTASLQRIYDIDTGIFPQGGPYELTVRIPNCFYQIDFVCGYVIDKLGPAGSNIFYTPQDRLLSADNGGTHDCVENSGSLSGFKFNDLDTDGVWDANELGLKDWTIYVDANNNNVRDSGELATVTDKNGFYKFNNVPAGNYYVREVQKAGWLQSVAPATPVTLAANGSLTNLNFGNYQAPTGSISGYKYNDRNADGEWDKNGLDNCLGNSDDEKGLEGWRIYVDLDGDEVWDANEPSDLTDANGYYKISGLAAGNYDIREVCQTGWVRTTDDANVSVASGQTTANVNVGNFKGNLVMEGDTATVNFWKGVNGQKLIKRLNGGGTYGTATALGNWLASNFPNMYGSGCGSNNLSGKTNAQVASYLVSLANDSSKQLQAQVLATVLAVYVTDTDWAGGTYAASFGFNVSSTGVKNDYFNIGNSGAAFGVQNDSILTVWQILVATNARANDGVLWSGYSSTIKSQALWVFVGINGEGGI